METNHNWLLSLWAGVVAGVLYAGALSWLLSEGSIRFKIGFDLLQDSQAILGVVLLLFVGVLIGGLVVAPRLHPMASGIPAAWFAIVFGPSVFQWVPPSWYPGWVDSLFVTSHSPAPWVILGILTVLTVISLTRSTRLWSRYHRSTPQRIETEQV